MRSARILLSLLLLGGAAVVFVTGVAVAGSITDAGDAQWGSYAAFNINKGSDLDLETIELVDAAGDWYRHPYDGVFYAFELEVDDGTWFADRDRCLESQAWSAAPTLSVDGNQYRVGTHLFEEGPRSYQPTVPTGMAITLPATISTVTEVRFLTAGAKNGASNYTVRFNYSDATFADVIVPILQDTEVNRNASGSSPDWDRFGWLGVEHTSNPSFDIDGDGASDCQGDGADQVWVTNPSPANVVVSVSFIYPDYSSANAFSSWLGGPLAVTVVTDEYDYALTWLYEGDIDSGEADSQSLNAGVNSLWYELSWQATIPGDGSRILVEFLCSDGEGTFTLGGVIDLGAEGSRYTLPSNCAGQYGRYRAQFSAGFEFSPVLEDITFWWDPDADGDGYGADGSATDLDCDDTDAAINPGAAEQVGDEVDQNCDGMELCWLDSDVDGDRSETNTVLSLDQTCSGFMEAPTSAAIDCNDSDSAINSGAAELPGDNTDQNCDNLEICYADADLDGYRHATNTSGPTADLSCSGPGQALEADPVDCNDSDPAVSASIDSDGDGVCDDVDVCAGFDDSIDTDGDGVPDDCDPDLHLDGWIVNTVEVFEACRSITATYFDVRLPAGEVTFRAGEYVVLGNDFLVNSDGVLIVEIQIPNGCP